MNTDPLMQARGVIATSLEKFFPGNCGKEASQVIDDLNSAGFMVVPMDSGNIANTGKHPYAGDGLNRCASCGLQFTNEIHS